MNGAEKKKATPADKAVNAIIGICRCRSLRNIR
mgnify:CR=1 FL=1